MRERNEDSAVVEHSIADRLKVFQCPECLEEFEAPEKLGSHLVRHEEVGGATPPGRRGKPTSEPCPKGCGRYFPLKQRHRSQELRAHQSTCDGSAPLVPGARPKPKLELVRSNLRLLEMRA